MYWSLLAVSRRRVRGLGIERVSEEDRLCELVVL